MEKQVREEWSEERVIQIIRTLAAEDDLPARLTTAPISGKDTALTLGLDSIGAFALIDRLEAEVGVPLPDDFLRLEDSVMQIAKRLRGVS